MSLLYTPSVDGAPGSGGARAQLPGPGDGRRACGAPEPACGFLPRACGGARNARAQPPRRCSAARRGRRGRRARRPRPHAPLPPRAVQRVPGGRPAPTPRPRACRARPSRPARGRSMTRHGSALGSWSHSWLRPWFLEPFARCAWGARCALTWRGARAGRRPQVPLEAVVHEGAARAEAFRAVLPAGGERAPPALARPGARPRRPAPGSSRGGPIP